MQEIVDSLKKQNKELSDRVSTLFVVAKMWIFRDKILNSIHQSISHAFQSINYKELTIFFKYPLSNSHYLVLSIDQSDHSDALPEDRGEQSSHSKNREHLDPEPAAFALAANPGSHYLKHDPSSKSNSNKSLVDVSPVIG